MFEDAARELTPTGTLRAGINVANFLLVTGTSAAGEPEGVSPDLAREIATRIGVPLTYVPMANASLVADAVGAGACDIGLIGAEPVRAEKIAFTAAYAEIEATYIVPAGSAVASIAEVDRPGVRIAVAKGAAYDLWLTRHIQHAELVRAPSIGDSYKLFKSERLDALAGLRTGLMAEVKTMPGARILDGHFTTVQQAVGTARTNLASAVFLASFVEEAKRSGLIARLIEKHGVVGLSVAPTIA